MRIAEEESAAGADSQPAAQPPRPASRATPVPPDFRAEPRSSDARMSPRPEPRPSQPSAEPASVRAAARVAPPPPRAPEPESEWLPDSDLPPEPPRRGREAAPRREPSFDDAPEAVEEEVFVAPVDAEE
jgi:hypothetical protein